MRITVHSIIFLVLVLKEFRSSSAFPFHPLGRCESPRMQPQAHQEATETTNVAPEDFAGAGRAKTAAPSSAPSRTTTTSFYRRPLPATCIALSSRQGRKHFASALQNAGLRSFFSLIEQHSTQTETAYCGVSTLVVALNALSVDPRQTWRNGPWRWYEEGMLNCCIDLEQVKQTGITLQVFRCLAICQGLRAEVHYAEDESSSVDELRKVVQEACMEPKDNDSDDGDDDEVLVVDRVLIASYSRKVLGQTGSGHFSPIAAYDGVHDMVLILDTARFKYGAHWVKLPLLFEAMQPIDPDTGRSRGYVMLIHETTTTTTAAAAAPQQNKDSIPHNLPISLLLRTEMKQNSLRLELKRSVMENGNGSISYADIERFCTKEGTAPNFVWELVQPQLKPCAEDTDTEQLIVEVRALIAELLSTTPGSPFSSPSSSSCPTSGDSECRPNMCRMVQLRPEEAAMVIYLACLDQSERERIVLQNPKQTAAPTQAKEQLLAEAALVRLAIDTSEEIERSSAELS